MAWVDPDAAIQEIENGLVVWLEGGDAQDGVPAALEAKAGDIRGVGQLAVQVRKIRQDAILDLGLDDAALLKPGREGALDGGIHGEEGVGDDFEAVEGCRSVRAGGDNPAGLHLGQAGDFAEATDNEDGDIEETGGECGVRTGMAVVEKDFVDDEGQVEFTA